MRITLIVSMIAVCLFVSARRNVINLGERQTLNGLFQFSGKYVYVYGYYESGTELSIIGDGRDYVPDNAQLVLWVNGPTGRALQSSDGYKVLMGKLEVSSNPEFGHMGGLYGRLSNTICLWESSYQLPVLFLVTFCVGTYCFIRFRNRERGAIKDVGNKKQTPPSIDPFHQN